MQTYTVQCLTVLALRQVTIRDTGQDGSRATHDNNDNGPPQAQLLRFDARYGFHGLEFVQDRLMGRFQVIATAARMR
jgi:hypothetical protein